MLAPIFKKLGLIEQWGTGFRKIQEALKEMKVFLNLDWPINHQEAGIEIHR